MGRTIQKKHTFLYLSLHFTNKNDEAAIAEHHRDTGKNNFLRGGHSEYKLKIFEDAFLELVVHGGEETGWMVTGKRS